MKTKAFILYNGRQYQITPGAARQLAGFEENALLVRKMLRLEGYTAAELDRPAPDVRPMEQLPLFQEDSPWTSH